MRKVAGVLFAAAMVLPLVAVASPAWCGRWNVVFEGEWDSDLHAGSPGAREQDQGQGRAFGHRHDLGLQGWRRHQWNDQDRQPEEHRLELHHAAHADQDR